MVVYRLLSGVESSRDWEPVFELLEISASCLQSLASTSVSSFGFCHGLGKIVFSCIFSEASAARVLDFLFLGRGYGEKQGKCAPFFKLI